MNDLLELPIDPSRVPPRGLGTTARSLWNRLNASYAFDDDAQIMLLELLVRAYDRSERARAVLAKEGEVVKSSTGPKQHPACVTEAAAWRVMLTATKQLGLTLE